MDRFLRSFVLLVCFGLHFTANKKSNLLRVGTLFDTIVIVSPSRIPVSSTMGSVKAAVRRIKQTMMVRGSASIVVAQPCTTQPNMWNWPLLILYDTVMSKEQLEHVLRHSLNVSKACGQIYGTFEEQRLTRVENVGVVILFNKQLKKEETERPTNRTFEQIALKAGLLRHFLNSHGGQKNAQYERFHLETYVAVSTDVLSNERRAEHVSLLSQEIASAIERLRAMESFHEKKRRKITRSDRLAEGPYNQDFTVGRNVKVEEAGLLEERAFKKKSRRHIRTSKGNTSIKKPTVIINSIKVFRKEKMGQPGTKDGSQKLRTAFTSSSLTNKLAEGSVMDNMTTDMNRTDLLGETETPSWDSKISGTVGEPKGLGNFDEHDKGTPGRNDSVNGNVVFLSDQLSTRLAENITRNGVNKQNTQWIPYLISEKTESNEGNLPSTGVLESNQKRKGHIPTIGAHLNELGYSVSSSSDRPELSRQRSETEALSRLNINITEYAINRAVNVGLSMDPGKGDEWSSLLVSSQRQPPNVINSTEKNESVETESKSISRPAAAYPKKVFERGNNSNEYEAVVNPKVEKSDASSLDKSLAEKLGNWFKQSSGYALCAATFLLVYSCLLLAAAVVKRKRRKSGAKKLGMDGANHGGSGAGPQEEDEQYERAGAGLLCPINLSNDIERYNASCRISPRSQHPPALNRADGARQEVFIKRRDSLYLEEDFVAGVGTSNNSSNSGCSDTKADRNNSAPVLPCIDTQPQKCLTISRLLWKELEKHYRPRIRRVASNTLPRKGKCKSLGTFPFRETGNNPSRQCGKVSRSTGHERLKV